MMLFSEAFWPSDTPFMMLGKDGEASLCVASSAHVGASSDGCATFRNIFLDQLVSAPVGEPESRVPDLGPLLLCDNYLCCKVCSYAAACASR
jgi:hypothetical protein